MKQSVSQLKENYAGCCIISVKYVLDEKVYCVTRHYANSDRLANAIFMLAVKHADREAGI